MRILPHLWQRVFAYALLLVLISHFVSSILFHFTTRREMHVRFLTELGIQMASVMKGKDLEAFDTIAAFLGKDKKMMWLEYPDGTTAFGTADPLFPRETRSSLEDVSIDARVSILRDPKTGSYLARVPLPRDGNAAVACFSLDEPLPPLYLMLFQNIIAVVIIGSALSLWITWRIARPLRRLRSEVLQIAEGNLETSVSEQGPEEVAQVAKAVNRMAHTMLNNIRSMRRLVADVSHEMRSPLARMSISAAIIQEGLETLTQGQEGGRNPNLLYDAAGTPLACVHLGYLVQEIGHMEKLVGSSLLNSRLDFQEAMPEARDVDVSSLCMDIALRYETLFADKKLTLNLDVQPALWVRGDEALLSLVVSNLLDNAVKYTDAGGRVRLVLDAYTDASDARVRLEVENSHPGLADEVLEHLFEPFFRGDTVDDAPGVGLGLTLVRKIAVRYGGDASVERTATGVKVRVQLPRLEKSESV